MSIEEPARLPTAPVRVPAAARDFQGMRAGIVSRVIANIVDVMVIVVVAFSLYFAYASLLFMVDPRDFHFPALKMSWFVILCGLLLFMYFAASWALVGRTVGDRLMGLRVVNHRGLLLRWTAAILRAAFCVAFPLGLFWSIISRENRAVQDVVLRSSVIYDWAPNRANLGHER